MTVMCAWCNQDLGKKEGPEVITHGVCEGCFEKELEKIARLKTSHRATPASVDGLCAA